MIQPYNDQNINMIVITFLLSDTMKKRLFNRKTLKNTVIIFLKGNLYSKHCNNL